MADLPLRLDFYRIGADGRRFAGRAKIVQAGVYVVGRDPRSMLQIPENDVSRVHCLIEVGERDVFVADRSRAGTSIGNVPITRARWDGVQGLQIPHYEIVWVRGGAGRGDAVPDGPGPGRAGATTASRLVQDELSSIFGVASGEQIRRSMAFPDNVFTGPVVDVGAVRASGFFEGECEYLGLGGGLGTFAWVDHLRIYGVPASRIRVIGQNAVPYANYARYCRYSQIPLHERLRSNSASTPDNIWGFPGYASREAWKGLKQGRLSDLRYVFDVFGEPAIRQSYTPRAGDVFDSVDVEAARIGWQECFLQGKVIGLRMTTDGRYAVAYRVTSEQANGRRDRIMIARTLHVAVGYPATRYTRDLQDFLHTYREDRQLIVNAYERHDGIYEWLEKRGKAATVVVRGRGIVASRILQRLRDARSWNTQLAIVHQMRTALPPDKGERWGRAKRLVFNDVELQPFNWPKACWGGEFRRDIERAPEALRARMFKSLGGTTTALRHDWMALPQDGAREGWYRKSFGVMKNMQPQGTGTERKIAVAIERGGAIVETITADFIIDCTGLIADPEQSPFLRDLIQTYALRRNKVSGGGGEQQVTGISVSHAFEIEGLRNGQGRVFAAGALTQNGPYAPVDSFLGLQYSALRSVEALADAGAPDVSRLGPIASAAQWWKWRSGRSPEGRRIAR